MRAAVNLRRGAAEICLRAAARAAEKARRRVPVRTGRLRGSIRSGASGDCGAEVSASAPYAAFVEYGTRRKAARPYLMPSAKEEVSAMKSELSALVKRAFEEIGNV